MGEVGDRLRQAREAKGLTLEQVEEITRIRRRYIQALEEEDYGQLPGEVFVRGFLRNYATVLGLDAQEILAASGRKLPPLVIPVSEGHGPPLADSLEPPRGHRVMAVVIGAMIVGGLALGAWTLRRYLAATATPAPSPSRPVAQASDTPGQVAVQNTATPTPPPTATATAEPTQTPQPTVEPRVGVWLRVEFTQDTWMRVVVDGQVVREATLRAGQVQEWQGRERIEIRCGNAGGVRIWFNGQEQPALGGVGQVVDRSWTAAPLPGPSAGELPSIESTPGPLGTPPMQPSATRAP